MTGRPPHKSRGSILQEYSFPGKHQHPSHSNDASVSVTAAAAARRARTALSVDQMMADRADTRPRQSEKSGEGSRTRSDSLPAGNRTSASAISSIPEDILKKISNRTGKVYGKGYQDDVTQNSYVRTVPRPAGDRRDVNSEMNGSGNIGLMSFRKQESAIIEDLLFTMMGIEGKYITVVVRMDEDQDAEYTHKQFRVDERLDPSLRDLAARVLPLATTYLSLEAFIELHSRFEYGFVSHALCAAIRGLLKEYLILIAQLENQATTSHDFTLQKLWFYIQPTMQTLTSLDALVDKIREAGRLVEPDEDELDIDMMLKPQEGVSAKAKGGNILDMIATDMTNMSGDPVRRKLYSYLLTKSSVPYIAMLESWISRGEIRDPYEEFLIVESKKVNKENIKEDFNDAYWEQRYTIRADCVPSFLEPLKSKILLAGKYLNVIRECGIHVSNIQGEDATMEAATVSTESLPSSTSDQESGANLSTGRNDILAVMSGGRLVETIETAYRFANRKLLDLLLKEKQLLGRLRSMKRYFFLDQSDYFTHFLDLASVELKRHSKEVSLTKLQSLLDLVLRNPSSVTVNDAFKEDLKVEMSHLSLVDQLLRIINVSGLDAERAEGLQQQQQQQRQQLLAQQFQQLPTTLAAAAALIERNESRASNESGAAVSASLPVHSRVNSHPGSNDSWREDFAGAENVAPSTGSGSGSGSGPGFPSSLGGDAVSGGGAVSIRTSGVTSGRDSVLSNAARMEGVIHSMAMEGSSSTTKTMLSGMDALTLDYMVTFPLSLVISRKALTKYQLLFRHLLYLKHGEQVLCYAWTEHAKSKVWKNASPELKQWRGKVFGLRARMLTFVQQFAYYVCSEVLEPNWRTLVTKLEQVSTVDQVLQIHSDFLDTCLNECMLTNSKLLRIYSKLMSTCLRFANYTDRFTRALSAMEAQLLVQASALGSGDSLHQQQSQARQEQQVAMIEQSMRRLNELEDGFLYHVRMLIDALNFYSATETVQFLCLVVRLDYNQFYANQK